MEADELTKHCESIISQHLKNLIPNRFRRPGMILDTLDVFLHAYQQRADALARIAELDPDIVAKVKPPAKPSGADTSSFAAGRPPSGS